MFFGADTWIGRFVAVVQLEGRKVSRILLEMKTILLCVVIPICLLPILRAMDGNPGRCAYGASLLILFWVFEVLPLPVTSLLPALLFPVLGVLTASQVCSEYIKDPSITVIGIFGIVAAVERWGLHRRIALGILILFGTKPHWLILGMLVTTSLLSMFITAGVTVLMLPIVRGIMDKLEEVGGSTDDKLQEVRTAVEWSVEESGIAKNQHRSKDRDEIHRLYKALALCVSYGSTVGSTATLTGAPDNFIMVGLTQEFYGHYGLESKVTFISWFIFTAPLAVLIIFLTWVWFVLYFLHGKGLCRRSTNSDGMVEAENRVRQHLKDEYKKLGSWSYPEMVVLIFLVMLVAIFVTEDLYFVPGWGSFFETGFVGSSAPTSLLVALLFIIPAKSPLELFSSRSGESRVSRFAPLVSWNDVSNSLPWGILLLVGAAFALVKATQESGLTLVIGTYFEGFAQFHPLLLTLTVTALTTVLTEFISNAATITMLLPIVGHVAILANMDPLGLIFPLTLAAKFAFMMPIATPPNAITYTLGVLTIKDMASAGFILNILTLLSLNLATHTWGKAYFRWDVLPDQMRMNTTVGLSVNLTV